MTSFTEATENAKDSVNISEHEDEVFTITAVEDSPYEESGKEPTPGVKITTVESWGENSEGEEIHKLHTTRRAIVNKLQNSKVIEALQNGETFRVKCPSEKVKPKGKGMPYYDLVEA